ncbi:MAG TPA: tetratricopeptide repeat protein [Myxococcales bacterium]|nr:tetratricopeptide repeat protein [Myxococcales bacterium]
MAAPLLAELKRRRVFRALLGYAIVAFAVLQVIEPIINGLHLPEWTLSFVVVALVVSFPVVLVLAWVFDVNPGGIERTLPLPVEPGARRFGTILALAGTALVVAATAALGWHFLSRPRPAPPQPPASLPASPSVAVLPFVNLSREKDDEYFSDGVTEEVINALANLEGVRVVSRTSAFAFKGKNLSVRKIAEELAVATVLEGSVRREGSDLRIVAQLINAQDGYHLWSKTYDRKLENVFAVEDELAHSIADALRPQLLKGSAPLVRQATFSAEAHDLYLQGRHFWNKRTEEDLRKGISLFQKALDVDPGYALAYSGLADCYMLLAEYGHARVEEILPKGTDYARKALELNPSLAEPHATLGLVAMDAYDWAGAEREFKRAIELRSGYATAHHWYGLLLATVGRLPEARAEIERAQELDPASVVVSSMVGLIYYAGRDYARAIDAFQKTLELDPKSMLARAMLACAYAGTGRKREALEQLAQVTDADAEHTALRAWVLWMLGEKEAGAKAAREVIGGSSRSQVRPGVLAGMYWVLGDHDRAFSLLDQAYAERDRTLREIKLNPQLDPMRADPRYRELLKKMKLD